MACVGLIANPAAGRDIRRLTGGAVVSDNYAKRRTAASVVEGVTVADDVEVVAMPDRAGIGEFAVEEAPDCVGARLLDVPIRGTREDTRKAAARLRELADAVVVLGGDGTTRDVSLHVGNVPIVAVSTGTNNVVPDHVDGTVAGAAAALVADGAVPLGDVAVEHSMVEGEVVEPERTRSLTGLATMAIVDRPFIGTRAILHGEDFVGGVVSRASPHEIGLSGIAGAVLPHGPDDAGGVGIRLTPPADASRAVNAITVPGVVERIGVEDACLLGDGDPYEFDVGVGVVSVDGERELEVTDATVTMSPVEAGPYVVECESVFEAAAARGCFEIDPAQM